MEINLLGTIAGALPLFHTSLVRYIVGLRLNALSPGALVGIFVWFVVGLFVDLPVGLFVGLTVGSTRLQASYYSQPSTPAQSSSSKHSWKVSRSSLFPRSPWLVHWSPSRYTDQIITHHWMIIHPTVQLCQLDFLIGHGCATRATWLYYTEVRSTIKVPSVELNWYFITRNVMTMLLYYLPFLFQME